MHDPIRASESSSLARSADRAVVQRFLVVLLAAILVLLIDQSTKALVVHSLGGTKHVDIIFGLLRFDSTRNSGAAFGLFPGGGFAFALIAAVVITAMLANYRRIARAGIAMRVASGMIAGGAVGNLIDRVRLGYVIDFIDLRWWYVFNLADSAIVLGVALVLLAPRNNTKSGAA